MEPLPDGERWRVTLVERQSQAPPRVRVSRLADRANANNPAAYTRLRRLAPLAVHAEGLDQQAVARELARLAREHPNDVGAWLSGVSLAITGAKQHELEEVVRHVLTNWLLPTLRRSSLHLVETDSVIGARGAALRALLYVAEHPEATTVPPSQRPDGLTFASAEGLTGDLAVGLSAYLSPLLLSHAPWVWGLNVARPGAVFVFNFGQVISGRRGEPAEALQLFSPASRTRFQAPSKPTLASRQLQEALRWWVRQLDLLLTEVFDPANHVEAGEFQTRRAFERHLGVEQLFRTVQSLSVQDRDAVARRALLFDALDTLEGLTGTKFDARCRLRRAQRAIDQLALALPPDVAPVLLPRAQQAVDALRELQEGFFLPGRLREGGLQLPDGNGQDRVVSLENATASWLRMLRNAGHAFGSKRQSNEARDAALLVAHDGRFPAELPDLAYLYLLELLAYPQRLQREPSR